MRSIWCVNGNDLKLAVWWAGISGEGFLPSPEKGWH